MSENQDKNWLGQTVEPKVEPTPNPVTPLQNPQQISTPNAENFQHNPNPQNSQFQQQNPQQNPQPQYSQTFYDNNGVAIIMSAEEYTQYQQMTSGWSWAGSFLTSITLIVSKKWGLFILNFILYFIPFVNLIAGIGWIIYGGLQGKKWIYENPNFVNLSEKQGAIKALESAGFVCFLFIIIGLGIGIFGSVLLFEIIRSIRYY